MELKEDLNRRPVYGGNSSQDTEDSDHGEILRNAFGVTRARDESGEKDESAVFLAEHRKKEMEWRKRHG